MQEPALADLFQEVAALREQVSRQERELNELKGRSVNDPLVARPSTSRRRMLRHLAGGIVAGLTFGGATLANGGLPVQAGMVFNPSNTNNQIGAIIVPPGLGLPTGTPNTSGNTYHYGLVATDGSNSSLSALGYFVGNVGVSGLALGYSSSGVFGSASGQYGTGVYGYASGFQHIGVTGHASDTGTGVYGESLGGGIGVSGSADGRGGFAGYFFGDVGVGGTLTKLSGAFKIDHPLDPANQYLYHSFVESPDMLNIYNGLVTLDAQGTATVELPAWFETLNSDYRYGLTAIGQPAPDLFIAHKVKDRQFKIAGGQPGQEVSWQLTGIRQDEWAKAHRIPVEEAKPDHEKGLYLRPELYGQSQEKQVRRLSRSR